MFQMPAKIIGLIAVCALCSPGQEPSRTEESPARGGPVPVYRVTVVEHAIDAVNYQYRSLPTKVDFRGTVLLPDARGEATVQSRRGRTEIEAKFENLKAPTRFGQEYLTYVLWALSPEGAPHNLGEVLPNASDRAKLHVTTDQQAFAMIVTAEPYSTVQQPSQVVAMENRVRPDTVGKIQPIHPRPELMRSGDYTWQVQVQPQADTNGQKVSMSRYEAVVEVYQAQNAIAMAQAANAETYAPDAFAAAQRALGEAQRLEAKKADSKLIVQNARAASQSAEDARTIAEKRKQGDQLATAERQKSQAEADARRAREEAQAARAEADRAAHEPSGGAAPAFSNVAHREASEPEWRAQLIERANGSFLAQDTPRGLVITLPDNAFDGINLLGNVSQRFAPLGSTIASEPGLRVNIQAYTDPSGSELQSWERAQAVRNILVSSGVAANQVSVRGMGAQSNRRVELVITSER